MSPPLAAVPVALLRTLPAPVNLNRGNQAATITPCITDIRQNECNLFIMQNLRKRRHAVRTRIACSDRRITAIENAANRVNRRGQRDAAVACQRGISAGRALPQIPMAILTMGLVDLAALPEQLVDLLR